MATAGALQHSACGNVANAVTGELIARAAWICEAWRAAAVLGCLCRRLFRGVTFGFGLLAWACLGLSSFLRLIDPACGAEAAFLRAFARWKIWHVHGRATRNFQRGGGICVFVEVFRCPDARVPAGAGGLIVERQACPAGFSVQVWDGYIPGHSGGTACRQPGSPAHAHAGRSGVPRSRFAWSTTGKRMQDRWRDSLVLRSSGSFRRPTSPNTRTPVLTKAAHRRRSTARSLSCGKCCATLASGIGSKRITGPSKTRSHLSAKR